MSSPSGNAAVADALVAAASAEDAAIYGYSVVGPRLASPQGRAVARGYYDVHRAQLQAVASWTTERGATPAPPAVRYSLPGSATSGSNDVAAPSLLLAELEESTAARYADLVAVADGSLRRAAALALQKAAVREAHWRGEAVPFPGLVDRLPGR